ncbi:MAG: amino acid ABC transporter permease [Actinobacteria bacterium]|nr:amino acid ABC transporter permease [Actinomycetota bacterium]
MNAFFNGEIFKDSLWLLVQQLPIVIEVLVLGLICAWTWGLILSLIRLSRFRPLRYLAGAYIDVFRGLPLLLLFIFIYYGLPHAGIKLNELTSGVLGLTLCYGAYSAEIFRAGIQAIPKGQTEAARSLGMTGGQAMRYVILPQAVKLVVPPLTNEFIAMIKDTALMSVISVPELLFTAKEKMGVVANSTPLTVAALIYLAFTIPLIRIAAMMENRRRKSKPGGKPPSGITPEAEKKLFDSDIAGQVPKGGEGW